MFTRFKSRGVVLFFLHDSLCLNAFLKLCIPLFQGGSYGLEHGLYA